MEKEYRGSLEHYGEKVPWWSEVLWRTSTVALMGALRRTSTLWVMGALRRKQHSIMGVLRRKQHSATGALRRKQHSIMGALRRKHILLREHYEENTTIMGGLWRKSTSNAARGMAKPPSICLLDS